MKSSVRPRGFSLVEIIIGTALVAALVTAVSSAWAYYGKLASQSYRLAQAAMMTEEGAEALVYMRDKGWSLAISPLTHDTDYYLVWDGTDYVATTTETSVNGLVRTISLASVYRDSSSNIVTNGGTLDPGTLTATISIYPGATTSPAILRSQMIIHDVSGI